MTSPYFIKGPALISFSGGRTSAYMLFKIIEAHNGMLPPDVVVAFANTGKEREETLRFVYECASRWDVKIHWVEWRRGKPVYEEVGFNSASRNGEPFSDLIAWKQRLPNGFERWCTEFLKVKIMFALVEDNIWKFWLGDNRDPKNLTSPLPQGFDLGLYPWEGNCTLCFQKGKGIRKRIIRENPSEAPWWIFQEESQSGWFDKRDLVSELVAEVRANPSFFDSDDDMDYDVECGLHCPAEAAE